MSRDVTCSELYTSSLTPAPHLPRSFPYTCMSPSATTSPPLLTFPIMMRLPFSLEDTCWPDLTWPSYTLVSPSATLSTTTFSTILTVSFTTTRACDELDTSRLRVEWNRELS